MHMREMPKSIIPLLQAMKKLDASDLHLKTGVAPTYRIGGHLRKSDMPVIPPDSRLIEDLMQEIIPQRRAQLYEERGSLDFAHMLPDGDRFRVNILRAGGHMHAAIRRVKPEIPDFEELHLPPIYRKLADETYEGLILVCGVTGCGKSTTMAAMVDHINETRHVHIISIEDPVEYSFKPKQSIISQREIGLDLEEFSHGLRAAVREDPDVIFVGELRDKETVLAALQAAETGHVVFGTLHTADTMQSLTRMLEFFPREQHEFIRSAIANGLKAITAQRLLPAIDPKILRVPATEVLLAELVVKEKIRDCEEDDLPAIISASKDSGMHNFTMSLAELVEKEFVYLDTALEYAPNREQLIGQVRGIKAAAQTLVHRVKRVGPS
jgi:twitching motility protein PilT